MIQYIDKDALVAEMKRLIERAKAERVLYPKNILAAKNYLFIEDYDKLLSFLDTFEVKEVDLEMEIESYWKQCDISWCRDAYSMTHIRSMLSDIAKHFFELGLKVNQKGE